jgi:hypothetical protein
MSHGIQKRRTVRLHRDDYDKLRSQSGKDSAENLITLCSECHVKAHQ